MSETATEIPPPWTDKDIERVTKKSLAQAEKMWQKLAEQGIDTPEKLTKFREKHPEE